MFLWQIGPWIPEACFYGQRANRAAVLGIVTKRGILTCCNASHTPPEPPLNTTLAASMPASDALPCEPLGAQSGFARQRARSRNSCQQPAPRPVPQSEISPPITDAQEQQFCAFFLKNMLLFNPRFTRISGMWYLVASGSCKFPFSPAIRHVPIFRKTGGSKTCVQHSELL